MGDFPLGADTLAPGSVGRFASHRLSQGTKKTTLYPNPFFDIAQQYMPGSIKDLFRWCRYYAMNNSLIATVLYKMSSYPITDVIYETTNPGELQRWRNLFEDHFKIRPFLIEANLDRLCYGNAFLSVVFPFHKMLTCRSCKFEARIDRTSYRFKAHEFVMLCDKCGNEGVADVKDKYTKNVEGVKLVRWNPDNITIQHNEITGEKIYYYDLPKSTRNDIALGKPSTIESLPQAFLEAARKNKNIRVKPGHIFHIRRPTISRFDAGWGQPLISQVLKQIFYLQVLQKAQESIFFGYITPMRVIYPAAGGGVSDPYSMVNLTDWREKVADEVREHRRDSNYIAVMPLPVGYQNIGGEGKALMLANEIRVWSEHIVSGMGVPPELIFSGMSYSGTNVSLRMLENEFLGNTEDNLALLRFVRDQIAGWLGWSKIGLKFKPFKMADDLQRAAFDLQLVQQKMLSLQTLLESRDHQFEQEKVRVAKEQNHKLSLDRKEQEFGGETQGRIQVISAKYQAKAQEITMAAQQAAMAAQQALQPQVDANGNPIDPNAQPQVDANGNPIDPNAQAQQPAQPQGAQPAKPAVGGEGAIVRVQSQVQTAAAQAQQPGVDINAVADKLAAKIGSLPEPKQGQLLGELKTESPQLYELVLQRLNAPEAAQPLPDRLPPRRSSAKAQV